MWAKRERGFGLGNLLVWVVVVVMLAIFGMRVVPSLIEYYSISKSVQAMTEDVQLAHATPPEIRASFDKRASVGYITTVKGSDLDISKDGNNLVIAFSYTKQIPLGGPISLLIDFKGSSKGKGG